MITSKWDKKMTDVSTRLESVREASEIELNEKANRLQTRMETAEEENLRLAAEIQTLNMGNPNPNPNRNPRLAAEIQRLNMELCLREESASKLEDEVKHSHGEVF